MIHPCIFTYQAIRNVAHLITNSPFFTENVESIPVKITEGDIAVSLTGDQDDDDKLEKKATVRNLRYIWQNRTVFYTLDNSLASK